VAWKLYKKAAEVM